MTTLIDVARLAGVSKSTVSNVIRGATLVSDATRKRVERAIAKTGYHPNVIARSLKARTSMAIGIVVPDLTNPFYGQMVMGAEQAANRHGYALLAAHTECKPQIESEAGRALIARRVDGVIIAGISLGSTLPGLLLDRDIPVTLASFGEIEDDRLGVIDHNERAAMKAIVDHLHGLGHRKLAFVSHNLAEHAGERRRLEFVKALMRRDLKPVRAAVQPTALVAHNDMHAVATMDRLEREGLRVPGDISVVGYDDIPLASHARIRLTTVRSDGVAMGQRAVDMVLGAARAGRHVSMRETLPNRLVIRDSTARIRA